MWFLCSLLCSSWLNLFVEEAEARILEMLFALLTLQKDKQCTQLKTPSSPAFFSKKGLLVWAYRVWNLTIHLSESLLLDQRQRKQLQRKVILPYIVFTGKRGDGKSTHQVKPWQSATAKLYLNWTCFLTRSLKHTYTQAPCTCAGLHWKELIAEWKNLTFVFLITSNTSFLFVQSEKYHRAQQRPHLLAVLICPSVFPSSSLKPQAHYFILCNVSF